MISEVQVFPTTLFSFEVSPKLKFERDKPQEI